MKPSSVAYFLFYYKKSLALLQPFSWESSSQIYSLMIMLFEYIKTWWIECIINTTRYFKCAKDSEFVILQLGICFIVFFPWTLFELSLHGFVLINPGLCLYFFLAFFFSSYLFILFCISNVSSFSSNLYAFHLQFKSYYNSLFLIDCAVYIFLSMFWP